MPPSHDAPHIATVYLHGFAHTHQQWKSVLARAPLLSSRPHLLACIPFHQAPGVTSFGEAVHALWRQTEQTYEATGPVRLVGYSLGARLALAMALAAPHRVASLLLVGAHFGLERPQDVSARRLADRRWETCLIDKGVEAFLREFRAQSVFGPPRAAPDELAAKAALLRHTLDPMALAASFHVLGLGHMPNAWPGLPTLRCPTDLVIGANDRKFCALAERAVRSLPNARMHQIENAGHDVLWDAPEDLAQILANGIASCPP